MQDITKYQPNKPSNITFFFLKENERSKTMDDMVSLDAAEEAAVDFKSAQHVWKDERLDLGSQGIDLGTLPDIAGARVSQRLQPVQDGLDRSIAKEVSNKLARDRKIAMQDEIDEHEMKESQKMLSEDAHLEILVSYI